MNTADRRMRAPAPALAVPIHDAIGPQICKAAAVIGPDNLRDALAANSPNYFPKGTNKKTQPHPTGPNSTQLDPTRPNSTQLDPTRPNST